MGGFALGFGSIEQDFEASEEAAIREFVTDRFNALGLDYITPEFAKEVRAWVQKRADGLHADADRYKTAATFPDRYSHYWPTVIDDASHIVVILSMHHVNRRHAMSPDGWALLQREPVFVIKSYRIEKREAA